MGSRLPEVVLSQSKESAMNEIRVEPIDRVKIDIGTLPPPKPRSPSDPPLKRAAPIPPKRQTAPPQSPSNKKGDD